ncbi:hypothetical protein EDB83DRAFT_730775 [Lactarius deliciosus]|nr:hypothetical protein EDB83DRAFT_730775 [Lactarius deliciosus]
MERMNSCGRSDALQQRGSAEMLITIKRPWQVSRGLPFRKDLERSNGTAHTAHGWCMTPVLQAPDAQYVFINTRPEFSIHLSPPRSNVMVRLSTVLGFAFAAISVLIPGVLSQDIPACAQSCAQSAADSSGCSLTDTNCICTNPAFGSTGGLCIVQQCSSDDLQAAQNFFLSLCNAGTSSSSPSSDTSTGTGTSTGTDTSTPTNTSSTPLSTTNTTPLTTATSSTSTTPRTTTTSPSSTRTSSTSTTSSSSSSTPSNHATHDKPAGVLGCSARPRPGAVRVVKVVRENTEQGKKKRFAPRQ